MDEIRKGLILAEDEALKAKLSGIVLPPHPTKGGGSKRVKVWYGMPSAERIREYPYITIDLVSIDFASDRAHSAEITAIDYWPSEAATFAEYAADNEIPFDPETQDAYATRWHPYDLSYQIATHTTTSWHDRKLLSILLGTAFLPLSNWGYLPVPVDDSTRWLDVAGFGQADYNAGSPQNQVRVFRKIFNASVSAHIPPENPFIYYKVLQVAGVITSIPEGIETGAWSN